MHTYQLMLHRVIPEQEINASERDQFWQKEEMEEKKRLEQERLRSEQERQKLEREVRAREEKETQLREQQVRCNFISYIFYLFFLNQICILYTLFTSGDR